MFVILLTAFFVVVTLVIVWLSLLFKGNNIDATKFSWLDDLKFKKK